MAISIINAEEKYIDQVYNIEQSEILVPWSMNSIKDLLKNNSIVFRVLIDDDKVLGYYSFAKIFDEGNINNIAVLKDEQSKGYGTLLMQDMLMQAEAQEIKALTLEVEINNIKAIGLYKKFNFINEGIRKNYYKNTYDAIIMWRR